jgi:membrane glycosyltransferase
MTRRRLFFAGLVLTTMAAAVAALVYVLAADGLGAIDLLMLAAFLVTLPWTVIGFWNAVIGLLVLHMAPDPVAAVMPLVRDVDGRAPLRGRTALVMPIFEEDPERVIRRLETMTLGLSATGDSGAFEVFLLSDTQDASLALEEARRFAAWKARDPRPEQLHYRRRARNEGHKAGNLWDFVQSSGERFDYMVVLDADSLMTGPALTRLVRLMDAHPNLGILQTLVTGLPSRSAFARLFQFGMRHGMRSYTTGSAWWQGDSGPYWGHNAILRLAPFRDHCRLPTLPGRPPFGGRVLSHDQVEAVLMRRAGYEVRVLPDEHGSFEESPPSLPDFLKRDLRWCQGNMQYTRLLGLPGLRLLGRLQLLLAILMYAAAPAWLAFVLLGTTQAVIRSLGSAESAQAPATFWTANVVAVGIGLLAAMLTMTFAPKLAGVAQTLLSPELRRAYGGAPRIIGSTVPELLFSLLISPVVAVVESLFIFGMVLFGRTVVWGGQRRSPREVGFVEACRGLWAPMLLGLVLTAIAWLVVPAALPWLAPMVTGLLLAAPVTWVTASPALGNWLADHGICATPEEIDPPPELRLAGCARPGPERLPSAPRGATAATMRPEPAAGG